MVFTMVRFFGFDQEKSLSLFIAKVPRKFYGGKIDFGTAEYRHNKWNWNCKQCEFVL